MACFLLCLCCMSHGIKGKIQLIAAPSILGLRPSGVECLADSLLACALAERIKSEQPVIRIPLLNHLYDPQRDVQTGCLNTKPLFEFSASLAHALTPVISQKQFAVVLGGDCSILLGIMPALKAKGDYGLLFLDAHSDFYTPGTSPTGEVADMDLAILTGRGPELLTNIDGLRPYVKEENVVHIGQRDQEETIRYDAPDIRKTGIQCISLAAIREKGLESSMHDVLYHIRARDLPGWWIHFDTDVLSDTANPAVDYRLPDGLLFEEVTFILEQLLSTGRIAGVSVTIFNPALDTSGLIAKNITACLAQALNALS